MSAVDFSTNVALRLLLVVQQLWLAPQLPEGKGAGNLDGDWRVTKAVMKGTPYPGDLNAFGIWRIKGNKVEVWRGAALGLEFEWKRDETLPPFALDIKYVGNDPNLKKIYAPGGVQAIYRLTDGALERCYADPGQPRPTEFRSTAENGWTLIVIQRVK